MDNKIINQIILQTEQFVIRLAIRALVIAEILSSVIICSVNGNSPTSRFYIESYKIKLKKNGN